MSNGLRDDDVTDAFFVISTPQDAALSARLRELARPASLLTLLHRSASLRIRGNDGDCQGGPGAHRHLDDRSSLRAWARFLKNALTRAMDARFTRFIARLAEMRERTQAEHPAPEESPVRREAMIEAARGFRADVTFEYPEWFDDAEP